MKKETLVNFVICVFCAVMVLGALIATLFCGAWWNLITGSMFGALGYVAYIDDEYDIVSVKAYFKNLKTAGK